MLAAAPASVQHLAGLGAGRHQRVIVQLAGVPVGGAGFGLAGNLTDRRVHIDGHRRLAGTAPGAPRPGQDLPCGLVQPPDMTPGQRAQESPHRGRRRRGEPQHRPRRARPQPVQVIDMRPPDRHRRHQRRHLPPRRARPGAPAQTHRPVHRLAHPTGPSTPPPPTSPHQPPTTPRRRPPRTDQYRAILHSQEVPPDPSQQPLSTTAILPGQRGTSPQFNPQHHQPAGGSRLRTCAGR